MAIVGIDMSLCSPGLVIRHENSWACYFVPQRQRERTIRADLHSDLGDLSIRPMCLSMLDDLRHAPLIQRMQAVVDAILTLLQTFPHPISRVYIEGYAFRTYSSSSSTLYELGGILRYRLAQANYEYVTVPPTRLKKLFTGGGRATKVDMYRKFTLTWRQDILKSVFRLAARANHIPNPVQDIVDAYALTFVSQAVVSLLRHSSTR